MRPARSVLAVSAKRSAKQFACGHPGGIFTVSIPGAGQDGVEGGGELSCFAVLRALVLGLPVVTTRRRRVVRGSWRVKRKASTVLISPW